MNDEQDVPNDFAPFIRQAASAELERLRALCLNPRTRLSGLRQDAATEEVRYAIRSFGLTHDSR